MKAVMRSASELLADKEPPERELGNVESVATTLVRNDTDAGSIRALPVVSSRPWTRAAKRAAEEAQRPRTVVTTSGVGHASEFMSSAEEMDTVGWCRQPEATLDHVGVVGRRTAVRNHGEGTLPKKE
ncbi:hypothetical protein GN958_ATG00403 [Phytophthora infestans]|uniref:Uncharacterized protein n=1 Tax=Phytophthora infestans TaxID=4787 RepID=A0A8S9VBN6_PHYIN|nr:hypothetical protein GN958_ATG00403 [Phytophthora infestans]